MAEPDADAKVKRATGAIRDADALLIAAGAGMGVDSGLPDFRGAQGFWRAYPAIAKLGLCFEEMANPAWRVLKRGWPSLSWVPAAPFPPSGTRRNGWRNTVMAG